MGFGLIDMATNDLLHLCGSDPAKKAKDSGYLALMSGRQLLGKGVKDWEKPQGTKTNHQQHYQ